MNINEVDLITNGSDLDSILLHLLVQHLQLDYCHVQMFNWWFYGDLSKYELIFRTRLNYLLVQRNRCIVILYLERNKTQVTFYD